jgi:hypothetical protein
MRKKWKKIKNETSKLEVLNRREALKKAGKYAAVTALGTFLILSPKKAQAASPPPPGGGF